jgi:heptosyltransferase-1
MSTSATAASILVVRLGAMGDVLHALPAVGWLKRSFPQARLTWLIEPRWAVLLEDNCAVDERILLDRRRWRGIFECWRELNRRDFDLCIDFQGLLKSAIPAAITGARHIVGFGETRERAAAVLYTRRVQATSVHVVGRNLDLALACGAEPGPVKFPLPCGRPEGELPEGPFVLASPLAGWTAKQWPLEHYAALAEKLAAYHLPLVLNGPPSAAQVLSSVPGVRVHLSSIAGLLDATRRAAAVVGVDSGPLHLAAALRKTGVAVFGPTDPARNGPYGGNFTILRSPSAVTTYKRGNQNDAAMREISACQVFTALEERLGL